MTENPKFILRKSEDLLVHIIYNQMQTNALLTQILAKIGGTPTPPTTQPAGEPFIYPEPYVTPAPKTGTGIVQVI